MRKHSWSWLKTWRFWRPPTRVCGRCGAQLRFPRVGPRGGKRYAYRASGSVAGFLPVDRLPECSAEGAPVVATEELYDAARL